MNRDVAIILSWNEFLKYPALYAEPGQIRFLYPDIKDRRLSDLLANRSGIEVLSRRLLQDLDLDGGLTCPGGLDLATNRLALLDQATIWQVGMTAALTCYGDAVRSLFLKRQLAPIVKAIGADNHRRAVRLVADGFDRDMPQRPRLDLDEWRNKAGELIAAWMGSLAAPIRKRVALKFPRAFGPALVVRTPQALRGFERLCNDMVDQCPATGQ